MVLVLCATKQLHLALTQHPSLALAQSLVVSMVLVLCSTMALKLCQRSLPWWYLALAPTNTAFKPRINRPSLQDNLLCHNQDYLRDQGEDSSP